MSLKLPTLLVTELIERIGTATIPEGLTGAGDAIFPEGTVSFYEMDDFADALEKLLLTQDRVCVVVLETMPFSGGVTGQELEVRQSANLSLMFCDRNWSNRQEAMLGGDDNPGVLGLIPGVVEAVLGVLPSGWVVAPAAEAGRLILLTGEEGDNQYSRACYRQPLTALGGAFRAVAGRTARRR
jgi:hypothetical protein